MAGTDRRRKLLTGGPAIILVEPQLGENIGMVARAMANFGLSELRLVRPRDGWPNEKARAAASRADHVIEGARVHDNLAEAIADLSFVLATTARQRDGFRPVRSPVEAAGNLRARYSSGEKTGILFGRERTGLEMEEIGLADEIVTFPVNPAFASLNLAQAVLLMGYEWMKSGLDQETDTAFRGPLQPPASKEAMEGLFSHLEAALQARGYFRPAARKPKMVDNLRAVFGRRGFTEPEVRLLRGVIAALDYFSPSEPRGRPPRQPRPAKGPDQGMSRRNTMRTDRPIVFFDSGIGGLTVLREARILMPAHRFVYIADDAGFPYGAWEEDQLQKRLVVLFGELIDRWQPSMIVIACNTASTLAIQRLRQIYPGETFVGTVPAIKPAAERTRSGLVSVLATPGTVRRQYTRDLIREHAGRCHVRLVGSDRLATLAEAYMRDGLVDESLVAAEIAPCFVEQDGRRTDIVVLACTHYPFLVNRMRKMAPWPVDWIDTSEAIARRALALAATLPAPEPDNGPDRAIFTSGKPPQALRLLVRGFGLSVLDD